MITQSLHFEITGQDAQRFLSVCQERNIEPMVAFESFLKDFKIQPMMNCVPKNWLMQGHCRIWQIQNLCY